MLVMFKVTYSLVLISIVVRNDWHFLFDQSEWVLVPEMDVLQKLSKRYVEDKRPTSDITKVLFVLYPCIKILTGDHLGSRRTNLSVQRSSCTYVARTDLSFLGHQ